MEIFGPFETGRLLDSGGGATVYEAKKEGDRKGRYAVKVFSLEHAVEGAPSEEAAELAPLFHDIAATFTQRINVQKQAAEGSGYVAPILGGGQDERGIWYATHFYVRSIQGMLDRLVVLETPDLHHVVLSVVRAALHFKKACGRSHGNLKPSNIFLEGAGKPKSSQVVVTDPLPGGGEDAARYELADLRSVGELLYQLALHRKADFSSGWVILPVEATKEWSDLFGKRTAEWLALCNRLLDPALASQDYNLEKLEADLLALKPKQSVAVFAVPAVAALVVVSLAAGYLLFHHQKRGNLLIKTDPPDARVAIVPIGEGGFEDKSLGETNTSGEDGLLKLARDTGEYAVVLSYPGLAQQKFWVDVSAGHDTSTNLSLPYGGLVVLSAPTGARLQIDGHGPDLSTPFTNRYFKPGDVELKLQIEGYETATVTRSIPSNHAVVPITVRLSQPPPSDVLVEFTSDPPDAEILVDDTVVGKTPLSKSVKEGAHRLTARLPFLGSQERTIQVRKGRTPPQQFSFPYGTLAADSDPKGANIVINGQLVGVTPTNFALPPGRFNVQIGLEGYETNSLTITLADKTKQSLVPSLKAMAGFVEVTSDPPGAQILDETGQVLGTTTRESSAKVPLPPGSHKIRAVIASLGQLERPVDIRAGRTESASFAFPYGTVNMDIEPPDVRSIATIQPAGQAGLKPGDPIYQQPNQEVAYTVQAEGYVPWTNQITVAAKQKKDITVALAKITLPVRLEVDPPGIDLFANGQKLNSAGPEYQLPWGRTEFVARDSRLGAMTNVVDIKLNGANPVPPFKFDYGTVILTNLPDDVAVKEGGDELAVRPGPMRLAFDRPGPHVYELYQHGQKVDALQTNLPAGLSIILHSDHVSRGFRNSIGMTLARVPDLLGPGKDGYVGVYEVTQKQYLAVMGSNPSGHAALGASGDDYPVENVPWSQADEFCQRLTQMDQDAGVAKGKYVLPTRDQWLFFAKDAALKDSVVKTNQPARVGSRAPNAFGLYDVRGNVWEWLAGSGGTDKSYVGGAYDSRLATSLELGHTEQRSADYAQADIGFRVIMIPNP
jgi:PEGA domain/Sulfatase-modifying factor enzyme 1